MAGACDAHKTKRRHFLPLIACLWLPKAVRAQQQKVVTIGVLVVGIPASETFFRSFRQHMRTLDYIEGDNVRYEFRSDGGQAGRLPDLAAELVRLNVDVIVTWYTPPAHAAKQATRDIPIVMALAGNPVETGLVESLDRPGGNITGMAGAAAELASKTVELIQQMLPSARRVVALANALDPFSKPFVEYVHKGGQVTGIATDAQMIRGSEGLEAAFEELDRQRPDAVIVQPSLPRRRIAELARAHKIPAASIIQSFAEEGGLMTYAPSEEKIYRRAAMIVARILKGAKPADIPVEWPAEFELLINLKTARMLNLTIPPLFLARADMIID
jgi:putative tryptophan/tyrosine transport system substrate-binding protein